MHAYASNTNERVTVYKWLAFTSVILAFFITFSYNFVINHFQSAFRLIGPFTNWLIGPSSMLGVWVTCYLIFDKYIWKFHIGDCQPFSKIPNLNGTWKGEIHSESRCEGKQVRAVLNITQTWSKILVKFESEYANSYSRMAMLNIYGSIDEGLNYEFASEARGVKKVTDKNEDFAGASVALRGTVSLRYFPRDKALEGDYYTKGDGAYRIGTVKYTYLSHQLLSLREAREMKPSEEPPS